MSVKCILTQQGSKESFKKLKTYTLSEVATIEGQTEFPINLSTFDASNDTVFVQSGITILFPNEDFTISDNNTLILTEGVPLGRTIGIYIMKILNSDNAIDPTGTLDGGVIAPNTIPSDRLEEEFLPLDGSKAMTGDIELKSGNGQIYCNEDIVGFIIRNNANDNSNKRVIFVMNSDASDDYWNKLENCVVFQNVTDNNYANYRIYGEHNKDIMPFLPLSGGTLTGNLEISSILPAISLFEENKDICSTQLYKFFFNNVDNGTVLLDRESETKYAYINLAKFKDLINILMLNINNGDGEINCRIFGEHNKPSGSYVGNGQARTIQIGGIGRAVLITGGAKMAIITTSGALIQTGNTVTAEAHTVAGFGNSNRILSLAANSVLNTNGVTYEYELL